MATSYTPACKLGKPAVADRNWDVALSANCDQLEALAPIAGLNVSETEIPSASLNVKVAPGVYPNSDGSKATYAGAASQAIAASSTKVLYLDSSGSLTIGTAYPTAAAHIPLATVVTGLTTVASITDDRVPGGRVLITLASYANDSAAASGGLPINGLYHTSGVVHVRLS